MNEPNKSPISVNFLDTQAINTAANSEQNRSLSDKKHTFIYFIVGVVILLAVFALISAVRSHDQPPDAMGRLTPKKFGFFQSVKNFLFAPETNLSGSENDRINILLLGIGGPGHDGPYLSDTNIILSLKPSTNEVAMISIPRDLAIKIDGYGTSRINFADAYGEQKNPGQGGGYARQVFAKTFNLDIPYYARVNFAAFEQLIDAVNGVDVEVERSFTDYSYPGPNFSYQTITFVSGTQHLNGDLALKFSRSRHGNNGENSDFARAKRQQKVIAALKDELLSFGTVTSPATLQKIFDSIKNNVATNLDFSQMLHLASIAKDVKTNNIKNMVVDAGPNGFLYAFTANTGAFMLAPKGGNFDAINSAIANIFNTSYQTSIPSAPNLDPTAMSVTPTTTSAIIPTSTFASTSSQIIALEGGSIEIQNGTWRAGLASRYQSILSDHGFNIITIGNSLERPFATTTIYLINSMVSNELLENLRTQIKGRLVNEVPERLKTDYDNPKTASSEVGAKYNPLTDILIILGNDIIE